MPSNSQFNDRSKHAERIARLQSSGALATGAAANVYAQCTLNNCTHIQVGLDWQDNVLAALRHYFINVGSTRLTAPLAPTPALQHFSDDDTELAMLAQQWLAGSGNRRYGWWQWRTDKWDAYTNAVSKEYVAVRARGYLSATQRPIEGLGAIRHHPTGNTPGNDMLARLIADVACSIDYYEHPIDAWHPKDLVGVVRDYVAPYLATAAHEAEPYYIRALANLALRHCANMPAGGPDFAWSLMLAAMLNIAQMWYPLAPSTLQRGSQMVVELFSYASQTYNVAVQPLSEWD